MVTTLKKGATKNRISDLLKTLASSKRSNGIDIYKYVGKINLKESPLKIQKKMRNEWE